MMKKVLPLMAAFAISLSLSASAEILTETREGHDFIMSYPVVRLENKKAAERINEDIEDLLVRIRDNYEKEQIQKRSEYFEKIGNCKEINLPGSHFMYAQHPEKLSDIINDFVTAK